jgi:hypothetical protein
MKAKRLSRLERLEDALQPPGEPQTIQVAFVNAQREVVSTLDFPVDGTVPAERSEAEGFRCSLKNPRKRKKPLGANPAAFGLTKFA